MGNTYGTLINTTEIKVYFASSIEIIARAISKNPTILGVSGKKLSYLRLEWIIMEDIFLKSEN